MLLTGTYVTINLTPPVTYTGNMDPVILGRLCAAYGGLPAIVIYTFLDDNSLDIYAGTANDNWFVEINHFPPEAVTIQDPQPGA